MALDDYLDPEVGIAVAVTAAVLSPPVRRVLRRGAVYGLAGLMMAGDRLSTLAQGVGQGMQHAAASAASAAQGVTGQAQAGAEETTKDRPAPASSSRARARAGGGTAE